MSVQSVYLINRGGGEGEESEDFGCIKIRFTWSPTRLCNFLMILPPQFLRGRFIDNQLSLVPSLYSVGGVWSPLYSLPPEKYVILPKSFSPPPPPSASYKLWLVLRRRQRDIITKNKGFLITLAQKKKRKKKLTYQWLNWRCITFHRFAISVAQKLWSHKMVFRDEQSIAAMFQIWLTF